jgi:hypothetical protein
MSTMTRKAHLPPWAKRHALVDPTLRRRCARSTPGRFCHARGPSPRSRWPTYPTSSSLLAFDALEISQIECG